VDTPVTIVDILLMQIWICILKSLGYCAYSYRLVLVIYVQISTTDMQLVTAEIQLSTVEIQHVHVDITLSTVYILYAPRDIQLFTMNIQHFTTYVQLSTLSQKQDRFPRK
jgi:hypothetical protein